MKRFYSLYILLLFLFISPFLSAQNGEIIKRAMKDELTRTMDSLSNSTCGKPCFVSFLVRYGKMLTVNSSMGSVIDSKSNPLNSYDLRLMIGDYQLNDENFIYQRMPITKSSMAIDLPFEPDYWGIRKALWSSCERTYENACNSYQFKKKALAENHISPEDYKLPDYSRAQPVKKEFADQEINLNRKFWEDLSRKVSSVFVNYPEIFSSNIVVWMTESTNYMVNSEGTEFTYPLTSASIRITASMLNSNNVPTNETLLIAGKNEKDFPGVDSLVSMCHRFARSLTVKNEVEIIKENYNGPVLFEGDAASHFLYNVFFNSQGLIANREQTISNVNQFFLPIKARENSLELKFGERITTDKLTIKAYSKLEKYNGVDLQGSFEVDAEGVIPTDELVLVENGKLINMLNGRTPTFGVKESNGYNRISAFGGKAIRPGVVHFSVTDKQSRNSLKKLLIDWAIANENNCAFIIRKMPYSNQELMYRVNLKTGLEELVQSGFIQNIGIELFKKDVLFSDDKVISNFSGDGFGGINSSVISPGAFLLKSVSINTFFQNQKLKNFAIKGPISAN